VFYAGRLAMTHFGPASIGAYRLGVKGFTWDVAVWPRTTGTGAAVGSGSGWVAPSAAANSEATWLFIQHLLSPTTQSTDAEAGSGVPVRMSTMQNVFVRQPAPPKNVQVFLENAKIARIVPQVPKWADMMTIVNRELNILWAGPDAGARCLPRDQAPGRCGPEMSRAASERAAKELWTVWAE